MHVTRRELLISISVAPLLGIFGSPASAQLLETLAIAGATALVEGLATNLASHILPPRTYVDTEILEKLRDIARRLDALTTLVARLPDVIAARLRTELERDRRSLLEAQQPQVDAIARAAAQRRPPRLSPSETARLNQILVNVQTLTDALWQYGPGVYPSAAFGVTLAIAAHRLLESDPLEIRNWVMDQVDRRFLPLTDPGRAESFRKRADDNAKLASELQTYLANFPRSGSLGRDNWPPVLVSGGGAGPGAPAFRTSPGPCLTIRGRVSPGDGVPQGNRRFGVRAEWTRNTQPAFPDFGYADVCTRAVPQLRPNQQARRLRRFLNERLDQQRQAHQLALQFDACSKDVLGVSQAFRRIVGG